MVAFEKNHFKCISRSTVLSQWWHVVKLCYQFTRNCLSYQICCVYGQNVSHMMNTLPHLNFLCTVVSSKQDVAQWNPLQPFHLGPNYNLHVFFKEIDDSLYYNPFSGHCHQVYFLKRYKAHDLYFTLDWFKTKDPIVSFNTHASCWLH